MSSQTRPTQYIEPLVVRGRIQRAQPKGLPLINLGYNELPYGPTPGVAEALARTPEMVNAYGGPGVDAVREALGKLHGLDPDEIICGNGSEELLDVIGRNFARPGDEILISEFGYIQFEMTARRVGATLVKAQERNFTTDVDALIAGLSERTRLVFLANPNNPTGTVLDTPELARLVEAVPGNVVVVLDLAYGEFTGEDYCKAVHDLAREHDNVIVTRTFSKAYGLAGTRLGWMHAPKWMLPGFYATRGMGSVNHIAQASALGALGDVDLVMERVKEVVSERERVAKTLKQFGISSCPSGTNFLMVTIDGHGPDTTEALVEYFFDEAGIIVTRTREAGLEAFLRFSLGTLEQNTLLLKTAQRFMEEL
ncbi:MAG: histidinol-phosphate transaminase [Arenibacterium sp.]